MFTERTEETTTHGKLDGGASPKTHAQAFLYYFQVLRCDAMQGIIVAKRKNG
jgi:hypothetical protein